MVAWKEERGCSPTNSVGKRIGQTPAKRYLLLGAYHLLLENIHLPLCLPRHTTFGIEHRLLSALVKATGGAWAAIRMETTHSSLPFYDVCSIATGAYIPPHLPGASTSTTRRRAPKRG